MSALLPNLYPGVSKPLEGAQGRYLMLGLGRQSVPMLKMAELGMIGPMPNAAIVAPMDDEVTSAMENLAWLRSPNVQGPIQIVESKPGMLARDFDEATSGKRARFPNPPYFTKGEDGGRGRLIRGCTRDYKIKGEIAEMKRLLGFKPGERMPDYPICEQWIGISANEAHRMAVPPAPWIVNRYPLIEAGWTVWKCLKWFFDTYGFWLDGSGCKRCPNRSMQRWKRIKEAYPDDFEVACQADDAARHGLPNVREPAYILDTLTPLRSTDIDAEIERRRGTLLDPIGDCVGGSCGL